MSPPRVAKRPAVALLVETSNAYARGLLRGVIAYIHEHRPWSVYLAERVRGDTPPPWLKTWRGDGIIARIENRKIATALQNTRAAVVDVSAARLLPEAPWVETDDEAIARVAVNHFLERNFRHFAYAGLPWFNWSNLRGQHVCRILAEAGFSCHVHAPARGKSSWDQTEQQLADWIATLPKPVGILACYDEMGVQVLEACRRRGFSVPDQVAVLGVDNDDVLCDLSDPPLSSVIPDTRRTGYLAAELLDGMLQGRRPDALVHLVQPLGIATRKSTDVLAIEDEDISAAVRFIREHACEGIKLNDVLDHVPLSRRVLESRFKRLIGRTPHEEIVRTQLARVQQLLVATKLPLESIADLAGFRHTEYLSVAFKKKFGLPPSQYRAEQTAAPATSVLPSKRARKR